MVKDGDKTRQTTGNCESEPRRAVAVHYFTCKLRQHNHTICTSFTNRLQQVQYSVNAFYLPAVFPCFSASPPSSAFHRPPTRIVQSNTIRMFCAIYRVDHATPFFTKLVASSGFRAPHIPAVADGIYGGRHLPFLKIADN